MANERLALVLLGAAVRVDVVDVGKVYLELFLGKRDSVVDVEQSFAPLCEVRRILNQLHATEMSTTLFVTAIDIVIRGAALERAWTALLLLQGSYRGVKS